ncbi:unnamed protein product [Didymodactylos carnosus]|uniref:Uncharacterized protein n=1 Tax=Didymodactylos carnosus TaxID=1234261 RepID=A0A815E2N1_9BILA|nr:unnamed protein product [Didymodactylos carnosus]CAF1309350.1 unnamed protein product [Didymodactylos carnosus]CAF3781197.1 unnamed protein product [Didymodactylos carnosus]CAF4145531.1 unnamed protein product [Didymodactylos carnosus]
MDEERSREKVLGWEARTSVSEHEIQLGEVISFIILIADCVRGSDIVEDEEFDEIWCLMLLKDALSFVYSKKLYNDREKNFQKIGFQPADKNKEELADKRRKEVDCEEECKMIR